MLGEPLTTSHYAREEGATQFRREGTPMEVNCSGMALLSAGIAEANHVARVALGGIPKSERYMST